MEGTLSALLEFPIVDLRILNIQRSADDISKCPCIRQDGVPKFEAMEKDPTVVGSMPSGNIDDPKPKNKCYRAHT